MCADFGDCSAAEVEAGQDQKLRNCQASVHFTCFLFKKPLKVIISLTLGTVLIFPQELHQWAFHEVIQSFASQEKSKKYYSRFYDRDFKTFMRTTTLFPLSQNPNI